MPDSGADQNCECIAYTFVYIYPNTADSKRDLYGNKDSNYNSKYYGNSDKDYDADRNTFFAK